jgi:2-polyprenyl-6-hydroxyphenyl methylase/3-demethylubiquinone-9 3-methyltransferase
MSRTDRGRVAIDPDSAPIDNDYYSSIGDSWWDTGGPLRLLHDMNPTRVSYFDRTLRARFPGRLPGDLRIVDVGCGGGLVSEALATLGYQVVGIDLSDGAVRAARRHAELTDVSVEYRTGSAYQLSVPDAGVDAVVVSDVLEHLHDLPTAVAEFARVLPPGGVLLFDTINRTIASYLVTVLLAERVLRFIRPGTHNWSMFIKPDELRNLLANNDLTLAEVRGIAPLLGPGGLVRAVRGGRLGDFTLRDSVRDSYIGHAVKGTDTVR